MEELTSVGEELAPLDEKLASLGDTVGEVKLAVSEDNVGLLVGVVITVPVEETVGEVGEELVEFPACSVVAV